jgi:hypothetical protein
LYLDDPFTVVQPKEIKPKPLPDPRREFWAQVPDMRTTQPKEFVATYRRCIFDTASKTVRHYTGCEHERPEEPDDDDDE